MRPLLSFVLVPLVAHARVCGSEQPPEPPAAAVAISAAPVPIASKHGGTVVAVEDVQLELLVKGDGEVAAYPVSGGGVATVEADAEVTVQVPIEGGGVRPVRLVYVPAEARFVGHVDSGVRVVTAPADVEVTVVARGRRRHRRVERVVVAPAVQVRVGAPAARVVIAPPPPPPPAVRVEVRTPQVDVRFGGPQVRVRVEDDDRHHDEGRRDHDDRGLHRGHDMGGGGPPGHGGARPPGHDRGRGHH